MTRARTYALLLSALDSCLTLHEEMSELANRETGCHLELIQSAVDLQNQPSPN